MKTTLIFGANRLTTELPPEDMRQVLDVFLDNLGAQIEEDYAPAEDCNEVPSDDDAAAGIRNAPPKSEGSGKTALFVFCCPDCGRHFTLRRDINFGAPGDKVSCNCGARIAVGEVRQAAGSTVSQLR